MNCSEFRERFDADPARLDTDSRAHLAGCHACTEYAAAGRRFETALAEAMKVEIPADLRDRVLASVDAGVSRRRFIGGALAAGVVLAAGAGVVWRVRERDALERELLDYLAAWPAPAVIASSMATADVNSLLRPQSIEVDAAAMSARVAKPCVVRGKDAVHLVIEVDGRLLSVVIMPAEAIPESRTVNGRGLQGTIVPAERGSVAIVALDAMPSPALVEQVRSAVRYI
jgi:hypothetical protein